MRITADRTRCVGSGLCAERLPGVFDQDDDALVLLGAEEVPPELRQDVEEVVQRCPTQALALLTDRTG
ncbi:ferredoxin [Streptomyces sp. NPDC048436]|uniref:ferredoxin n=1 Tax=Streptomyces sp. NPDC048436 TaxID=3365550 RepID=UPI00371485B9